MIGAHQLTPEEAAYRDEASRTIRALIPPDLPDRMDRNEIPYPEDYLRAMAAVQAVARYLGDVFDGRNG